MALSLVAMALVAGAANIGGEIRHPEIATGPPPVEQEEPPPSFAQSAGAILAGYQWAWAASETLHFVGLCLIFGVTLIVDLRMLGVMRAIPFATIHRLLQWAPADGGFQHDEDNPLGRSIEKLGSVSFPTSCSSAIRIGPTC